MVGEVGLYETPSEYVRDLIRRDMERRGGQFVQDAVLAGYRDVAAGRVFASSGDFKADMAVLDRKEADDWQRCPIPRNAPADLECGAGFTLHPHAVTP
jgi:antitoxin ParD1/3/4